MKTTVDLMKTLLEEVVEWIPILDDVADALLSAPGQGLNLSGVQGTSGTSQTERAVLQLREIRSVHVDVADLATDWLWRGRHLDGSPQHWLLAHLAWARANRAPDEYEPQVKGIHRRLFKLTGQGGHGTGRLCPGCGVEELRTANVGGHLTCGTCDLVRTEEEVDGLVQARLVASDASLPVNQASKVLGVSRHTINSWIRRGRLEVDSDRLVKVRDVRRLLSR